MSKLFGFDLLAEQICDRFREDMSWLKEENICESKIEQLFWFALVFSIRTGVHDIRDVVPLTDERRELLTTEPFFRRYLLIEPQSNFLSWRADFVIHAYSREQGWKSLIVECDGHNFHERTQGQAARDRSRDREAQLAGVEIFRFTGSELWRDPLGCVDQVIAWAKKVQS